MTTVKTAKGKTNSVIKGQLPGIKKYNSLKEAFKGVEELMGELHISAAQKGKPGRYP